MPSNLTVIDEATPRLREIATQLKNPQALYKDVGRRVARDLRRHFARREADSPNKLGGRRTHFWSEIRDAVQQPQATGRGVEIAIDDPRIATHVHGARITPKNARALTIPIHQLAHGRRASVFEDFTGKKLFAPKGRRVLMAELGGKAVPIYALARAATIPKDPRALPPREAMIGAILDTADKHLARMLARE